MLAAFAILTDGLVYAAYLFVVAIGLTLIFGVMKILNVTHGSFYAFGAFGAASAVGIYFEKGWPVAGGAPNLRSTWPLLPSCTPRVDALVVVTDPLFNSRPHQLAALAARYALPTIHPYREFTAAGGLISYGGNLTEPWYLAGVYAGRILKGEKAADLPIQQTTKLTTPTLLARADEVIE